MNWICTIAIAATNCLGVAAERGVLAPELLLLDLPEQRGAEGSFS